MFLGGCCFLTPENFNRSGQFHIRNNVWCQYAILQLRLFISKTDMYSPFSGLLLTKPIFGQ